MKPVYRHIIFDLDGTLSDSRKGIFNAYHYTVEQLNLQLPPPGKMNSLIGPSLQKGFEDVFKLPVSIIPEAIRVFREYYGDKGLYENELYEGIYELMGELSDSGARLYVATAKYELYANQVLEFFGIKKFFVDVAGADYNGYSASKTLLVSSVLRRNAVADPADAVVIGDTHYDVHAARELDLDSIGVTYGFSSAEEMASYEPDFLVDRVNELRPILLYA